MPVPSSSCCQSSRWTGLDVGNQSATCAARSVTTQREHVACVADPSAPAGEPATIANGDNSTASSFAKCESGEADQESAGNRGPCREILPVLSAEVRCSSASARLSRSIASKASHVYASARTARRSGLGRADRRRRPSTASESFARSVRQDDSWKRMEAVIRIGGREIADIEIRSEPHPHFGIREEDLLIFRPRRLVRRATHYYGRSSYDHSSVERRKNPRRRMYSFIQFQLRPCDYATLPSTTV